MRTLATELAEMPFSQAAPIWFESRLPFIKQKTIETNQCFINSLTRFFGNVKLCDLHIGSVMEYQKWRKPDVKPSTINHEVSVLSQILRRADLWDKIEKHYEPLPTPKWQPRKVLSEKEEDSLFALAAQQESLQVVFWVTSLTKNTTAGTGELRRLQMKDVLLTADPPRVHIPDAAAKNEHRARVIPLNDIALRQMTLVVDRAELLGAHKPEHYVFPFRIKRNSYDPTRPASPWFIRGAFRELKALADMPWLTPHMFRHMAITELLERGVPEQTVRSIAGHVSESMMQHYSHTRAEAKFIAVSTLNRRR